MSQTAQLFQFPEPTVQAKAESRFEEFWKFYPRKVGKPLAKAKFDAIVRGGFKTKTMDKDSGQFVEIELEATAQEIIDGTKRYVDNLIDKSTFKRKVEDKFIPHAATFLNQGRWMDE